MEQKKVGFSVRMPVDLREELDRVAAIENRSAGQVAIMAIREGLRARSGNGGVWSAITRVEVGEDGKGNELSKDGAGEKGNTSGVLQSGDNGGRKMASRVGVSVRGKVRGGNAETEAESLIDKQSARELGICPHGYLNWLVCRNNGGGCE